MPKTPARRAGSPVDAKTGSDQTPHTVGSFPIVGVGASAGGLEAFSKLLTHLPVDTGMGFVFVQHLDPEHESALTQLLARATALPVREVTNRLRVEPNHVYVIPPNTSLSIAKGLLILRPRQQARTPHRSIDAFFEALAEDQRERAIGVVLSGTATDGTLGLEAIKAEGGITSAQDDSARYDSMPRSAVAAGCVDFVLSPEQIAHELARIAKHPSVARAVPDSVEAAEDDRASAATHEDDETPLPGGRDVAQTRAQRAPTEGGRSREERGASGREDGFKRILLLLRNHSGVDFSLYKSSTIQRRITRRLVLSKQDTLEQYARFLRGNTKELDALYSDALISVTSFFRNPDAFDVLQRKVLPTLLQRHGDEPLRVWVLGCSTGQEAYSIAVAFVEAAEKAPRMRKLQVFATDLNDGLLDKARHGLYAKSVAQDLSPERVRRFFVEEEGGYRVTKSLREMVVFARQNLASDPPFSRMDLISCRNLLIYFEPSLQKKLLPVFHYALKPRGFLYLGASESIGGFTDLFEPVDKKHKIYSKKPAPTPAFQLPARKVRGESPPSESLPSQAPPIEATGGGAIDAFRAEITAQREADRITIKQFAPPAVLVNAELQILQFRGATSAYLQPPTGRASFDVLKMARNGLMLPLRAAIDKAKRDNLRARKEHVRVEQDGTTRTVNVEVIPLKNLQERCFLIVFEEAGQAATAPVPTQEPSRPRRAQERPVRTGRMPRAGDLRRIGELETELAETRDYLQSLQEQHEAANEELQASNEEVQSANEELQSINEELETSKEELESANEELTTVNEEMANRNAELTRLNSDLINIQTSSHLALVLVARNLTIRRFSPPAEKHFNLLAADVGRSISNIRHNLDLPDLNDLVTDVIDTVHARTREVQDKDGRWFSLRIQPYLTLDNKVDGAVLVLVDINDLKRSEQDVAAARDYAESIVETVRDPLIVLDGQLRVESANSAFYRVFLVTPGETVGRFLFDLGNGQWDIPELRRLLATIFPTGTTVEDFEVHRDFQHLGRRTMLINARRIRESGGEVERILLTIEDVTERKQAEETRATLAALVESSDDAIVGKDRDGIITSWNYGAQRLFGYSAQEAIGQPGSILIPADRADEEPGILKRIIRGESMDHYETVRRRKDGSLVDVSLTVSPIKDAHGRIVGLSKIARDISDRKKAVDALRESARHKDEFLAMLAHELRNPLAPICSSLEVLRRARSAGVETSQMPAVPSQESRPTRFDADHRVEVAMDVLERQVGQMVRLVDDLLDAGRISRGKVELRRERVELSSVVHHVVEAAQPLCEGMNQELTVTLPAQPVYLDADPARLAQIVGNLLNNASKFTDRGGRISLTVEREEESSADGTQGASDRVPPPVVIRVRDTGVGIAAEQLPRIFEMFTQVERSPEDSLSGLGIGLTLVKTLAEMHGGTVQALSAGVGHGSEFVVRLPTTRDASTALLQGTEPTASPRLRVLVVDDNRDSAEMLAILLQLRGHETYMAHDGLEAVEAAATLHPDVVLLDLGLPRLHGHEAARRIRAEQGATRPLLVAVTGWGQQDDRQRSIEAGFDAHLVKPVDEAALARLLADLGARQQERDE